MRETVRRELSGRCRAIQECAATAGDFFCQISYSLFITIIIEASLDKLWLLVETYYWRINYLWKLMQCIPTGSFRLGCSATCSLELDLNSMENQESKKLCNRALFISHAVSSELQIALQLISERAPKVLNIFERLVIIIVFRKMSGSRCATTSSCECPEWTFTALAKPLSIAWCPTEIRVFRGQIFDIYF